MRPGCGRAGQVRHLLGATLFDRNLLHAVAHAPVDGRGGEGDVEGHVVVVRGERLQVRADLVGDVAGARGAVGADDAEVHHAVLHQMTAGVVGDDGMRHALLVEFPGGEARALVPRPRLVHPDVHGNTGAVRLEDRRERRAPVDGGEPAGVAMREHVDGQSITPLRGDILDERRAVLADRGAHRDVLVGDRARPRDRRPRSRSVTGSGSEPRPHALERPAQVDRGRPALDQEIEGAGEPGVARVLGRGERHAIGGGRADQRRAAHNHAPDRVGRLRRGTQRQHLETVRQLGLVDHVDAASVGVQPDGAKILAVDAHSKSPSEACPTLS